MTDQTVAAKFQTSIVVLAYNGCDALTRPCIESLLEHTQPGSYELILVDNASNDSTADYFRQLARRYSFVRLCINEKNKGYAGGNNDGIRLATGRYIVLLNNDTLVGPGWLAPMLHRLETSPEIGLLGPVTNAAGNEQRIDLEALNEKNFVEVTSRYTLAQRGCWFETEKLGFFCVVGRREVFEQVGLLDERFGLGMFEDDDYCVRVRKAGYKLAIVEHAFVFHKGSMSFKTLPTQDYHQLFEKNRTYFFNKHGMVWTYADIATAIWICIKNNIPERSDASRKSAFARLRLMDDALYQLRQREENSAVLNGVSAAEQKLAEKHHQLMEISDWATGLKQDNAKLEAELIEKHGQLMEISDWATGLKQDNAKLEAELIEEHGQLMEISGWATELKQDNAKLEAELKRLQSSLMFRILRHLRLISV